MAQDTKVIKGHPMRKPVKAKRVRETPQSTVWLIEWPSTPFKQGKSYYATTYPDSDHLFLETAAKRRPVSPNVARNIYQQVKDAIARAG